MQLFRRLSALAAALTLGVLSASVPAQAEILWQGGFETGDFSEWDAMQVLPGRATIVADPVRSGGYAARFELRAGDNPLPCACGERTELVERSNELPGTVSSWAWSVYFPAEFAVRPGGRVVFTQWHDYDAGYAPHPAPVVVRVLNVGGQDRFSLGVRGGPIARPVARDWTLKTIERGRWHDLAVRIRWAPDGRGYIELMIDGSWVVPRTYTPTLFAENASKGVYFKQGLYRATPTSETTVAYLDATRRGRYFSDVRVLS
jgi:hypothetical protein